MRGRQDALMSLSGIPRKVRDRIPTAMLMKRFSAVFDQVSGETWVLAGEALDQEHAIKIALHEAFGHGAFLDLLKANEANGGKAVHDALDDIYRVSCRWPEADRTRY
jgi:hypothetical protein